MIYITDYIKNPSIEKKYSKNSVYSFLDNQIPHKKIKVLLVWHEKIDKAYLEKFPNLKAVVRYGVGFDTVNLMACKDKGVKVFNNPDYGVDEVSDTAVSMSLNFLRRIGFYNEVAKKLLADELSAKTWQENTIKPIQRSNTLKIGIIGFGRIGSSFGRKMNGMGFDISFYDPFLPSGVEKVFGFQRCMSIEELLKKSDLISLHVPLNEETKNMVNKKFLSNMKKGAVLINTSRGKLIKNLDILYDYLANNKLFAVGLDVLPEEPPDTKNKLINAWLKNHDFMNRIIINPHTAYYSKQSYEEMREKAIKMAINASSNKQVLNRII